MNSSIPNNPHSGKNPRQRRRLTVQEMCLFGMFGALMFASTLVLSALPNVHLLGMLIMLLTVVYRVKALIPLYLFILLHGIYGGFAVWWLPYLYVWTVLWGVTMLLPRKAPKKVLAVLYPLVCGLHGICFGILYAPGQALLFGYTWEQMLIWIANGFPYDLIHGVSNFCFGMLVLPLSVLFRKFQR